MFSGDDFHYPKVNATPGSHSMFRGNIVTILVMFGGHGVGILRVTLIHSIPCSTSRNVTLYIVIVQLLIIIIITFLYL